MNVKKTPSRLLCLLALCALLSLAACKKATTQETSNTQTDTLQVFVPESLKAQIQVAEVASQDISDTLRVAGQIDFNEQALTRIGASVTGSTTNVSPRCRAA